MKFINHQHKLNKRYATWVKFLKLFNFKIKHKAGLQNAVLDALGRKHPLLSSMEVKVTELKTFKYLYENYIYFGWIRENCKTNFNHPFFIFESFLFIENALCVLCCFLRLIILWGHFGRGKTLTLVQSNLYWSKC